MTELTAEKIRLVMLAIQAMRITGRIGPTEPVSTERMARVSTALGCPLSTQTFRRAESHQIALARLALEEKLKQDARCQRPERAVSASEPGKQ